VYGHQDDLTSFTALSRLAQLNVQMDKRAKTRLTRLCEQQPLPRCPPSFAFEGWQCSVNGVKITSDPGATIRRAVFGTKLKAHLVKKKSISGAALDDIDWDAMETTTALFPPLYRL
jgi:hypothetical protein